MEKNIRQELGKSRVAEVKAAHIFNGAVLGIIALWGIWVSTSLLIHFVQG